MPPHRRHHHSATMMRPPHAPSVAGDGRILWLLPSILGVLIAGCAASEAGPPPDQLGSQRPMLEQVTTDLGFPDDREPTDEEIGGGECSLSGCPTLAWIYPQDAPYTITTCEQWADTLEAAGYTTNPLSPERPRISEIQGSSDLDSPLQPGCVVTSQRGDDDYVFNLIVRGISESASQWEFQAAWYYG